MRAFVLAVLGWVVILLGWVMSPESVLAGVWITGFIFLAAFICFILGISRRQQRWWNIAALILLLPPLLALATLVVGGFALGS